MQKPNDEDHQSPRIFQNDLLERASRVRWFTPLVLYMPIVIYLAWISFRTLPVWAVFSAGVIGYGIWTLCEYFGHRYLFHTVMPGEFGGRLHFLLHDVHHIYPNDPLRLVMPPLMSIPLVLSATGIIMAVFGREIGYPILTGFIVGYILYDMVHYYTHYARPKTRLGIMLRRWHMLHHFRDHERGYGVSAPYWDYIFGTQHIALKKTRPSP